MAKMVPEDRAIIYMKAAVDKMDLAAFIMPIDSDIRRAIIMARQDIESLINRLKREN